MVHPVSQWFTLYRSGSAILELKLFHCSSVQATVAVDITVRQSNFPPVFSSSHYFAAVAEDLLDGDVAISFIQATDFDPVQYSLQLHFMIET